MYTKEQICEIVTNFQNLVKELGTIRSCCEATVNEADKAFGDIRHYCEFDYPTERKKRTKVCKLINQYSKERREAKDLLDVTESLSNLVDTNFINRMGKIANETKKALGKTEGRSYAPRVLNELFEDDDNDN